MKHIDCFKLLMFSIILTILGSCSNNMNESLLGLEFGKDYYSVKKYLEREGYNIEASDSIIDINTNIVLHDFEWEQTRLRFCYGKFDRIMYASQYNDSITYNQFNRVLGVLKRNFPNMEYTLIESGHVKLVDEENEIQLILLKDEDSCINMLGIVITQIPNKEELARRNNEAIRIAKEKKDLEERMVKEKEELDERINSELMNLNRTMIDYVRLLDTDPTNQTMREAYGSMATRSYHFLESHIDDMTDEQREWFEKLKAIEI